mgnify:FL=1
MTTRPFSQRPKAVLLLSVVIAAEGILIGYLAALQLIEIITGAVVVLVTGLSLLALLLGVTLWLFYVARSLLAAKRWARSGALFWQLIQLAVASASFSGEFASPVIGWSLIAVSALALALVFNPQVMQFTRGED